MQVEMVLEEAGSDGSWEKEEIVLIVTFFKIQSIKVPPSFVITINDPIKILNWSQSISSSTQKMRVALPLCFFTFPFLKVP